MYGLLKLVRFQHDNRYSITPAFFLFIGALSFRLLFTIRRQCDAAALLPLSTFIMQAIGHFSAVWKLSHLIA